MRRIRVLIVHAHVNARRRASQSLAGEAQFEVVATAPTLRIAQAKLSQVNPDVVLTDMGLFEQEGTTIAELRRGHAHIVVIPLANVADPVSGGEAAELNLINRLRDDLVPRIVSQVLWAKEDKSPAARVRVNHPPRIDVVAIGVSTGGPNALAALVPKIPADLPVPVVIVQHMPPLFTRLLAERLTSQGNIPFEEGAAGTALVPGRGWIAPGDFHMTVHREADGVELRLNQAPPENSCRPAVDVLFRSVADAFGPHTLAVVLTGMGSDGLRGCEVIRASGGRVIAQDEASSVVWGMPGVVTKAGLAEAVLPLDEIAGEIVRLVKEGRSWSPPPGSVRAAPAIARLDPAAAPTPAVPPKPEPLRWPATPPPEAPSASAPVTSPLVTPAAPATGWATAVPARAAAPAISQPAAATPAISTPAISTLAADAKPQTISPEDFAFVAKVILEESAIVLDTGKEYLVESRLLGVARKMGATGIQEMVDKLRRGGDALFRRKVVEAMTTNETSFFRDGDPFEALKRVVLPEVLKRRQAEKTLRIWCGASSSGQEPFSIAMLLRESFPQLADWKLYLSSSDISTEMLDRCRTGRYSQLEVSRGLPAPFLVKYFERDGMHWTLKPDVRNMVEFFEMNLAGAWPVMPPLDIVFMRNVLIYFDTETKRQILGKVRRLLRPDGYLFLGGAETTFNLDDGFVRETSDRVSFYRLTGTRS